LRLFLFLMLGMLSSFVPLWGQENKNINMETHVMPAVQGRQVYHCVIVKLTNLQEKNFSGRIEIKARKWSYGYINRSQKVSLASGTTKQYQLYLPPMEYAYTIDLNLYEQGRLIAERKKLHVPLSGGGNYYGYGKSTQHLGVLLPEGTTGIFNVLSGDKTIPNGELGVSELDLKYLPERWEGYSAFDYVLIQDYPLYRLRDSQIKALKEWVWMGGSVIVMPGVDSAWWSQAFFQNLIGDITGEIRTGSFPGFVEDDWGDFPSRSEVAFHHLSIPNARIPLGGNLFSRWQSDQKTCDYLPDAPIYQIPAGFGHITIIPFDLGKLPFQGWSGIQDFWGKMILASTPRADLAYLDDHEPALLCRSLSGKADTLPSFGFIIILLTLYIILVGPVNMLLLRRVNRPLLILGTVPVCALIFISLIFLGGYIQRGFNSTMNSLVVRESVCNSTASRQTLGCSLFPSGAMQARFSDQWHTLFSEYAKEKLGTSNLWIREREGSDVFEMGMGMWEPHYFMGKSFIEQTGVVDVFSENGRFHVYNGTQQDLSPGILAINNGFFKVDAVPTGKRVQVGQAYFIPENITNRKKQTLAALDAAWKGTIPDAQAREDLGEFIIKAFKPHSQYRGYYLTLTIKEASPVSVEPYFGKVQHMEINMVRIPREQRKAP